MLKKLNIITILLIIMILILGNVIAKEIFLKDSLEEKNKIIDKMSNPSKGPQPTQGNDNKESEEDEIEISKEFTDALFGMCIM